MKILTLNTHSLAEDNYSFKLEAFAEAISAEKPDIIALQEVSQSCTAELVSEKINRYVPSGEDIRIRKDNHLYSCMKLLEEKGTAYFGTWLPIKRGYGKYDEGIALMSRSPIIETMYFSVSGIDDYENWKTRKLLGIKTSSAPNEWFFSVHYGWWCDKDEPFLIQWKNTEKHLKGLGKVWLMGDFNNPAEIRGQGYDLIKKSGWYDSYLHAEAKDSGITVEKSIDGWNGSDYVGAGIRIDQIWCNSKIEINRCEVIFDGNNYPVVSDHYGVMVSCDGDV